MDTTTVTEFVKLISEYGIMIILCAVFIVYMIVLMKSYNKKHDEMFSYILESLRHPDAEETTAADIVGTEIYDALSRTLKLTGSDRAYLYLYHNGGVSCSGYPFQKMSCVSEVVAPGILPVSKETQNLHKSSYAHPCNKLRSSSEYVIKDVDILKECDSYFYQRAFSRHASAVIWRAVTDGANNVIGFVGVDFSKVLEDNEELLRIRSTLSDTALKLESLVAIRSKSSI